MHGAVGRMFLEDITPKKRFCSTRPQAGTMATAAPDTPTEAAAATETAEDEDEEEEAEEEEDDEEEVLEEDLARVKAAGMGKAGDEMAADEAEAGPDKGPALTPISIATTTRASIRTEDSSAERTPLSMVAMAITTTTLLLLFVLFSFLSSSCFFLFFFVSYSPGMLREGCCFFNRGVGLRGWLHRSLDFGWRVVNLL